MDGISMVNAHQHKALGKTLYLEELFLKVYFTKSCIYPRLNLECEIVPEEEGYYLVQISLPPSCNPTPCSAWSGATQRLVKDAPALILAATLSSLLLAGQGRKHHWD